MPSGFLSRGIAPSLPAWRVQAKEVRYLDIYDDDRLDEAQIAAWVAQGSRLPGKPMWFTPQDCLAGLNVHRCAR